MTQKSKKREKKKNRENSLYKVGWLTTYLFPSIAKDNYAMLIQTDCNQS